MSGFEVHPESLRASGRALAGAADRFQGTLQQALAQIGAAGQPWGSDDIGVLIGETHEVVAQALIDLFAEALDTMRADANDLVGMADSYDTADESASGLFRGLDSRA